MADKNKKVFEGKSAVDSALHDFCIKTKKTRIYRCHL